MSEIKIPNRAVPKTVVASEPINQNWDIIETSLNEVSDLAEQVVDKIDESEKGVQDGIATLDTYGKLHLSQLPESAKGHIYTVNSLSEQLQLPAYSGDICVRDGKTYALKGTNPTLLSDWLEIGSTNANETVGNPPYTNSFTSDTWLVGDKYFIEYPNTEHGQGSTKNLIVEVKILHSENVNEKINIDYVVSNDGTVTIYSDYNFNGSIIIANLDKTDIISSYHPYTVTSGSFNNGIPNLLSMRSNKIELICSPTISLIDGLGVARNIYNCKELLSIDELSGRFILFIDSANIKNNELLNISYVKAEDYLGVVTNLPNVTKNGQRCYKAFHGSYESKDGSWGTKAFVPIGECFISNGLIQNVITYKYNDNNVNANYQSSIFDYLYGKQIEGLNIRIYDNKITVSNGKCLGNKNLIINNTTIAKDCTKTWQIGNSNGCRLNDWQVETIEVSEVTDGQNVYYVSGAYEISGDYIEIDTTVYTDVDLNNIYKVAEENEFTFNGNTYDHERTITKGWGYIYLISNAENKVDLIISMNENPLLPSNFINYRRIGHVYVDENTVKNVIQIDNKFYMNFDSIITVINNEINTELLNLPNVNSCILSYETDVESISFYVEDFITHKSSNKIDTIMLPIESNVSFSGNKEGSITFKVIAYVDDRSM